LKARGSCAALMSRTVPWRLPQLRGTNLLLQDLIEIPSNNGAEVPFESSAKRRPRWSLVQRSAAGEAAPETAAKDPFTTLPVELRLRILYHLFVDVDDSFNCDDNHPQSECIVPSAVESRRATERLWLAQRSVYALVSAYPTWAEVLERGQGSCGKRGACAAACETLPYARWSSFWTTLAAQVFGCSLSRALYTVRSWSRIGGTRVRAGLGRSPAKLAQDGLLRYHEPCHCCGVRQSEPDLFYIWDAWCIAMATDTSSPPCRDCPAQRALCFPVCRSCFLGGADSAGDAREAPSPAAPDDWIHETALADHAYAQHSLARPHWCRSMSAHFGLRQSAVASVTSFANQPAFITKQQREPAAVAQARRTALVQLLKQHRDGRSDMGYTYAKARDQVHLFFLLVAGNQSATKGSVVSNRSVRELHWDLNDFREYFRSKRALYRVVSDAALPETSSRSSTQLPLINQRDLLTWVRRQRQT